MSKQPKITKDELKKELENGLTMKQIAHEYGYNHPSRALSDKARELGYRKNYNLTARSDRGGYNIYLNNGPVETILEARNLLELNDVYYFTRVTERNTIELVPTDKLWRKQEE